MTLAEIADYVCAIVCQTDADSVTACKLFTRARYRMLWDAAPWREALAVQAVETDPADGGELIVPYPISRVMAIRSGGSGGSAMLSPLDLATAFQLDPSLYDGGGSGGDALAFATLQPVAIPVLRQTAAPVLGSTETAATPEEVAGDVGLTFTVNGEDANGLPISETVVLAQSGAGPYAASGVTVRAFLRVTSIRKEVTGRAFTVGFASGAAADLAVVTLRPEQTAAPLLTRLRLLNPPAGATQLLIVGKRVINELLADDDQPQIRDADNVLIAFAQADLLKRNRQYAKAQAMTQEGMAAMQSLLDLERNQTATEQRIVPADIHGDGYW